MGFSRAGRVVAHCIPQRSPRPAAPASPRALPAPPLSSARWLGARCCSACGSFHPPIRCFTSPQLFLSLLSAPPHPGERLRARLGAGPPRAGWGPVSSPPIPVSQILSSRVTWLWPPSRVAELLLLPLPPPSFPPSPDLFNFHLSAACGRTD